jgi:hypothetical protein
MASYKYTFTSGDTVTPARLNDARDVFDIVNADIKSDAAIAGTKVAPDFGSQNITTTGNAQFTNVTALGSGFIGLRIRCHADAGAGSPELISSRSRGTASSPTAVGAGDNLLLIAAQGYDGSTYRNACFIGCDVDAATGSGDMAGRIVFSTSPDGSASPVERMRITSAGNVGINNNNPTERLVVSTGSGQFENAIRVGASTHATSRRASVALDEWLLLQDVNGNGTKDFGIFRGATRLCIDTNGSVGIGTVSPNAPLEVFISTGNTEYLRAGSSVSDRSLRFSSFAVSGTNSVGHDIKAPEANGTLTFSTVSSERVRITNSGRVGIGTNNPSHQLSVVGEVNTTEQYMVDSTQVVSNRVTGWGAPTGTISRSALTLTASATYSQSEINTIIQALKAVITDLRTHGLIGN